jgi:transposase-like protein
MEAQIVKVCPNPDCRYHDPEFAVKKRWYRPHGYYRSPSQPERQLRRYRCSLCGKTFSETYFTRSWHLRQLEIDEMDLLFEWCKGTPISRLARRYHCSPRAIETRIDRMRSLADEKSVVLEIESKGKVRRVGSSQ